MVNDADHAIYCNVPQGIPLRVTQMEAFSSHQEGNPYQWTLRPLSDFSTTEIEHKLKSYFKFMFVREPLDRLISAYKALHGKNSMQMRKNLFSFQKKQMENYGQLNFENFLRLITLQGYLDMDENWLPFNIICQPCYIKYDFVGDYASDVKDFAWILNRLHISMPIVYKTSLINLNSTLIQKAYSKIPRSVIKNVLKRYKKDYEITEVKLETK